MSGSLKLPLGFDPARRLSMSAETLRRLVDNAINRGRALCGYPPLKPPSAKHANLELYSDRVAAHAGGYLSVVIIVRDEAPDIREWVEFQRVVGVEHVYIYDDSSTDGTQALLAPFITERFVTLIPWSRFLDNVGQQPLAYAHALTTFGPSWRWMAFIDRDEYLFPVADESLVATLSKYEDLSALVVPWYIFGFSGHDTRPGGLVIENYTERLRFPPPPEPVTLLKWKSIVRPSAVRGIADCHFFKLEHGEVGGYTEDRHWVDSIPGGWRSASANVLRLNHYFTQSKEDFVRRRSTHHNPAAAVQSDRNWRRVQAMRQSIEAAETVHDELILRYVPRLLDGLSGRLFGVPGRPHCPLSSGRPALAHVTSAVRDALRVD